MNIQQIEQEEHEISRDHIAERFASEAMTAEDREREARYAAAEDAKVYGPWPEPTHEQDHIAGRVMDDRVCDSLGCPYAHQYEIGF